MYKTIILCKMARVEIGMALDGKPFSEWRSPPTPRSLERHFSKLVFFRHGSVDLVSLSYFELIIFGRDKQLLVLQDAEK